MNNSKVVQLAALCAAIAATSVADAEVVVVVSSSSATSALTAEQVADIYLGKSSAMKAVDLPESSSVRGEFYQKATQKDAAQVKAIWSRLIFTGKATPPKEVGSSADVKKALAGDPNAIGYIEKSALDGSVKAVLTIN
jgi:ABC-type phosphate transport system substrate-binding protein